MQNAVNPGNQSLTEYSRLVPVGYFTLHICSLPLNTICHKANHLCEKSQTQVFILQPWTSHYDAKALKLGTHPRVVNWKLQSKASHIGGTSALTHSSSIGPWLCVLVWHAIEFTLLMFAAIFATIRTLPHSQPQLHRQSWCPASDSYSNQSRHA